MLDKPPPNRPISTSLPSGCACCTWASPAPAGLLQLSRSRATRSYNKERDAEPATVMGVLYRYLQHVEK